jgi:hypothetical protein
MENIKKFEKYTIDIDLGEIGEEYAKYIISKFIDSDDITLEKVYADLINRDDLDDSQAYIIKNEILVYLSYLINEAKKIRDILTINAEKYNL